MLCFESVRYEELVRSIQARIQDFGQRGSIILPLARTKMLPPCEVFSRDVPDIWLAGYPSFFGIRYPARLAGYPVSGQN